MLSDLFPVGGEVNKSIIGFGFDVSFNNSVKLFLELKDNDKSCHDNVSKMSMLHGSFLKISLICVI